MAGKDFRSQPRSDGGMPLQQKVLPEGRRCDQYTINFCDKRTWYPDSARITDEELVDSGDHTVYNLTTPCVVVDMKHGRIFNEDYLVNNYGTVVKVDEAEKTENSPETTDGDYEIDYLTGAVTFNEALAGTETVTMSYSKVQTSMCKIKPPDNKKMRIAYVEVQVSKDFGLKDTLNFQLWGVNPQDPPNLIEYTTAEVYKSLDDFIIDSEKAFPEIPVLEGGDSWRMPTKPRIIFRFDYSIRAATDLLSSALMEIRVWLSNDTECDGEYAVGTFYGVKVDE